MKLRILVTLLIGLFLLSTSAFAAEKTSNGPYIGIAGGVSFFHDGDISVTGYMTETASYDTGYALGASVGYKFDSARLEFEFGYRKADMSDISGYGISGASLQVMSYMVNAFYDINTNSPFTPYIGLGLGLLNGELKVEGMTEDTNEFGFQLIAGIAYNFNKNFALDLSYRLQRSPNDLSIEGVDVEYMSSNFMLGLRYTF